MKCPNCQKEGCKYLEIKKPIKVSGKEKMSKRKEFKAKCKHCKWEGVN